MTRIRTTTAALLALATATAGIGRAQDGEQERPPIQPDLEDLIPGAPGGGPSPREEMIELFHSVERRLEEMRRFLFDAGAGDRSKLADVEASGIDELLKLARPNGDASPSGGVADLLGASRGHGGQVLLEIDRILQIAAENGGT